MFVNVVKLFVSEDEYEATQHIVKTFCSGIGKTLHDQLLEKAKHNRNWVLLKLLLINNKEMPETSQSNFPIYKHVVTEISQYPSIV